MDSSHILRRNQITLKVSSPNWKFRIYSLLFSQFTSEILLLNFKLLQICRCSFLIETDVFNLFFLNYLITRQNTLLDAQKFEQLLDDLKAVHQRSLLILPKVLNFVLKSFPCSLRSHLYLIVSSSLNSLLKTIFDFHPKCNSSYISPKFFFLFLLSPSSKFALFCSLCRHPLPDWYTIFLDVHPSRTTSVEKISCVERNKQEIGVVRCPDDYTEHDIYSYRSVNKRCTRLVSPWPSVLCFYRTFISFLMPPIEHNDLPCNHFTFPCRHSCVLENLEGHDVICVESLTTIPLV